MEITEEFKRLIEEDIAKCDEEVANGTMDSNRNYHRLLCAKYTPLIDDFDRRLNNLFYDETGKKCKQNLLIMKERLILFKAMGYKIRSSDNGMGVVVNNNVSSSVTITIEEAKFVLSEMSDLSQLEKEEALHRLDELKQILDSNDKKSQKWERAKGIVNWIADKGVDVAIAFLPLLLKIGEK